MQTERVTFLTSRDHKAALDAFAASNGRSVGHVLREASSRYIASGSGDDGQVTDEQEAELAALVGEVRQALPKMSASLDRMSQVLRDTHEEVDRTLRAAGIRK